jgi:hypothetical protein
MHRELDTFSLQKAREEAEFPTLLNDVTQMDRDGLTQMNTSTVKKAGGIGASLTKGSPL